MKCLSLEFLNLNVFGQKLSLGLSSAGMESPGKSTDLGKNLASLESSQFIC